MNDAGLDIFDPDAMAHHRVRPMFGGSPDATAADPDAAEATFQSIPPMAATFATMKADYDDAQGDGHWLCYLGIFFDRAVAPVGYAVDDFAAITAPTLILTGDRDMFCTVEAACAAYRTLRAGELCIVQNTAHEITAPIIDAMTPFADPAFDGHLARHLPAEWERRTARPMQRSRTPRAIKSPSVHGMKIQSRT